MAVRQYLWDPVSDCVLAETDELGNTLVSYTSEPDYHGRLISECRSGEIRQYHFDAAGNTRALTDIDQNVTDTFAYDAWGNEVARTGTATTPFRWMGERGYHTSADNLPMIVRRRQYGSAIARWTSQDPVEFWPLINAYVYALNAPTYVIDPSGEISVIPVKQRLVGLKCGDTACVSWNFRISAEAGAPCTGYLVQEVSVTCTIYPCDAAPPAPVRFTYYEAWRVTNGRYLSDVRKAAGSDFAFSTALGDHIGEYIQKGTIRFVCDPDGRLLAGWHPGSKNPENYAHYGPAGPCQTTGGELPTTDQMPSWWHDKLVDAPAGERSFELKWNCCDCGTSVKADASPKKDFNVRGCI